MEGSIGKILIVDDDENICEVIKMYVESAGYETKVVNDGKTAETMFLEYKPDLVLLDIMLPNIDGIDVLKWIRKEYETPVIMLTAKGETFDKVLGLELWFSCLFIEFFNFFQFTILKHQKHRPYNLFLTKLHANLKYDQLTFITTFSGLPLLKSSIKLFLRSHAALSAFIIRVLLHLNSLFLQTMSVG